MLHLRALYSVGERFWIDLIAIKIQWKKMHGNKFTEVLVPYTKGSGSHQKTSEELKNQEIYLPHLLSVN